MKLRQRLDRLEAQMTPTFNLADELREARLRFLATRQQIPLSELIPGTVLWEARMRVALLRKPERQNL